LTRVKQIAEDGPVPDPNTRDRLLDAAWQEAVDAGPDRLTLAAVAARAGVSRQAVYLHFGNRATLLADMAARFDHTSGFRRRLAATRGSPPRDGFLRMLAAWFDYVPAILPVFLALEAAQLTGDEGATAYRDRMNDWREGIRIAVARLSGAGLLAVDWTVDSATDWTWALVHPINFHHLTGERGWPPDEVGRRLTLALERDLL
jgi:AcrR family transcriptional regulator